MFGDRISHLLALLILPLATFGMYRMKKGVSHVS